MIGSDSGCCIDERDAYVKLAFLVFVTVGCFNFDCVSFGCFVIGS